MHRWFVIIEAFMQIFLFFQNLIILDSDRKWFSDLNFTQYQ